MDAISFLHELRRRIVNVTGDETAIVRLEADKDAVPDALKLVVIVSGRYLPWQVDASDFENVDGTFEEVVMRVVETTRNREPPEGAKCPINM